MIKKNMPQTFQNLELITKSALISVNLCHKTSISKIGVICGLKNDKQTQLPQASSLKSFYAKQTQFEFSQIAVSNSPKTGYC